MNINTVIISGRLTKDPEIKKVGENDLCSFRVASNRIVGKNKTEKSIFIDIDAWGGQAKACNDFLKKGSRVTVQGVLCQDSWKGKDGTQNSKIFIEAENVMFIDAKQSTNSSSATESQSTIQTEKKQPYQKSTSTTHTHEVKNNNNQQSYNKKSQNISEDDDEVLPF